MDLIPYFISKDSLETYTIKITSKSKIIYWIIIGIVVFSLSILPLVKVDVSVQARGYFQSDIENQLIYAPSMGKILYSSIHNGVIVKKGDTLLVIESESIRAKQNSVEQMKMENDESILDIEKLVNLNSEALQTSTYNLKSIRYQAEYDNLKNQLFIQGQKYKKSILEHERNKILYSQAVIPEVEYNNSLFLLNSEKNSLDQILVFQKSIWQNDLVLRRIKEAELIADIKQCKEELSNRIILSPISGKILRSSDFQPGSFVSPGQIIGEISSDGDLIATCFVKPSDIGMIRENQKVKIQVDAFNYNEWGMLNGVIINISDDMITENSSTAFFRIKCRPDTTFLYLKNGHKANIKKGMSINTRIFVIKRSLFNLLFDKAGKWFNPYNIMEK